MPSIKKNVSVILYDVNCQPDFQSAAKDFLLHIFATKWFSGSNDCTKIIFVNTLQTNNQLNRKFNRAPHIKEVTDVISYDPCWINSLFLDIETAQADWIVALAVALQELKDNYEDNRGIFTLQILFITDFSNLMNESKEKQLNFVITTLNTLNIFLYIIGPRVIVPMHISTGDDVRHWAKNVQFIDDTNDKFTIVKKIVQHTKNSIVCDLQLGRQLFLNYKNVWNLQVWPVPLTAGTSLKFSANTYRFLRAVGPPSIKPKDAEKSPWKWHLIDDVMIHVPYDDVVGGVVKHGKFVPLSSDVEKNFKCYGERSFKIIGFTNQCNVPEAYMSGKGSSYVRSEAKNFNLLLHVLAKKNMCAIVRKTTMKNCKPKLLVLLPELKENVFVLAELPYKENISTKVIEQNSEDLPSLVKKDVKEVYEYLEKLDITKQENKDENGSVKVPLSPILMSPIRIDLINKMLLQKYLDNEYAFEDTEVIKIVEDFTPYLHLCPFHSSSENRATKL